MIYLLFLLLLSPDDGEKSFKEAKDHFEKGRYAEAGKSFQDFIHRYPKSPLFPSALYYRGRLFLDPERAVLTYEEILSHFPKSPFAEDARLLISKYHEAKGDSARAREVLETSTLSHPEENHKIRSPENDTSTNLPIPTGEYTVQVGSFENLPEARRLHERLKKKGYKVFIIPATIEGKTFHRVRVGGYATKEEALKLGEVLKEREGLPAWVVRTEISK